MGCRVYKAKVDTLDTLFSIDKLLTNYTSKECGGLGLRHASLQNKAFMMKVGWGFVANKDGLWARVIRSKYNCDKDLMSNTRLGKIGSRVWSGIKNIWENVQNGIEIVQMNGESKAKWKLDREWTIFNEIS